MNRSKTGDGSRKQNQKKKQNIKSIFWLAIHRRRGQTNCCCFCCYTAPAAHLISCSSSSRSSNINWSSSLLLFLSRIENRVYKRLSSLKRQLDTGTDTLKSVRPFVSFDIFNRIDLAPVDETWKKQKRQKQKKKLFGEIKLFPFLSSCNRQLHFGTYFYTSRMFFRTGCYIARPRKDKNLYMKFSDACISCVGDLSARWKNRFDENEPEDWIKRLLRSLWSRRGYHLRMEQCFLMIRRKRVVWTLELLRRWGTLKENDDKYLYRITTKVLEAMKTFSLWMNETGWVVK